MLQKERRLVYDGVDTVQERDGSNLVVASSTWAGHLGGLLSRATPDGHYFYHYGANGNVTGLTDSSQNVAARYRHDAYRNT